VIVLLTVQAAQAASLETALWTAISTLRVDPHNSMGFALLTGLVMFSTTTALLYLRERSRWARREHALTTEIADLRGVRDRADMLMGSERQLVIAWNGRDEEPRTLSPLRTPSRSFASAASASGFPSTPRQGASSRRKGAR
jgi:hypothetical protein